MVSFVESFGSSMGHTTFMLCLLLLGLVQLTGEHIFLFSS